MPDTTPHEPESRAPERKEKSEPPFVWPRDLNTPSTAKSDWGSDPEALRDA